MEAVKRSGGVSVNSLLQGYAFRVPYDGVWRDGTGLIRIFANVVLMLIMDLLVGWLVVVLVGGVVGNSDRRLFFLLHCLKSVNPKQHDTWEVWFVL